MAIPFAVAVLNDLLAVVLEMFQSAGVASGVGDPSEMVLQTLRDTLAAHCAITVGVDSAKLLSFVQRLRNDIVHSGGRTTQKQIDRWADLNGPQRARWEAAARRTPALALGQMADLGAGEVRATWSVARGYAREVNEAMVSALPRAEWARIAVEDFKVERPTKIADASKAAMHAARYARTRYKDLQLCEADLAPHI